MFTGFIHPKLCSTKHPERASGSCTAWLPEQEMLKPEIGSTDGAIDNLVYELYGLSLDEIKIVEGRE